ncbi:MAG: NAD(+)/NADH kinase, partial [Bacteroidota bacterium]
MKFGVAGNLDKAAVPDIALELIDRFKSEKVEFVIEERLAAKISKGIGLKKLARKQILALDKLPGACEILVSLGGDGTILRMARLVAGQGTPILGVNVGKLGFLAEVSLEDLEVCITELLQGDYLVQERMMLSAVTSKNKKSY